MDFILRHVDLFKFIVMNCVSSVVTNLLFLQATAYDHGWQLDSVVLSDQVILYIMEFLYYNTSLPLRTSLN